MQITEQCCASCKWHDDFSWVCFNGDSPDRADFTDDAHSCTEWEAKEDEAEE